MSDLPALGRASSRENEVPDAFSGQQPPQHPQTHFGGYQTAPYSASGNQQQQFVNPQQHAYSQHVDLSQGVHGSGRGGLYNMSAMVGSLPQPNYRAGGQYNQGHNQQHFNPQNAANSNMSSQHPAQQTQYDGQGGLNPLASPQQFYHPQHAADISQYYPTTMSSQALQTGVTARSGMGYYPNPVIVNQQASMPAGYYYPQAQYSAQGQALPGQVLSPHQFQQSAMAQPDPRFAAAQPLAHNMLDKRTGAADGRANVVRGPPRKPKQSGHAIWIGNLPPQTDLMQLVHHVCKEAPGLESLFLISKSNCAFANFKDEPSCLNAQQKIHDSKFQSIRLVSRLRKNAVEGATGITAPTGPAAISSPQPTPMKTLDVAKSPRSSQVSHQVSQQSDARTAAGDASSTTEATTAAGQAAPSAAREKYFILKSLTEDDLLLSVQNGIWATQSHNEEALNKAFDTADNVYLVFSANKSGEYFGYARMTSPINNDPAAAIEFAPKAAAQTATDIDLPKATPTEATEHTPKGRIIDDSARGTIFWEADRDEASEQQQQQQQQQQDGSNSQGGSSGPNSTADTNSIKSGYEGSTRGDGQAWGKPFHLEWLSTNRLPFYRTRGLRNPWNSNREVKIARDGTELEPTVGRRLLSLFERVSVNPPRAQGVVGHTGPMPGMIHGFVPVRPPYQN